MLQSRIYVGYGRLSLSVCLVELQTEQSLRGLTQLTRASRYRKSPVHRVHLLTMAVCVACTLLCCYPASCIASVCFYLCPAFVGFLFILLIWWDGRQLSRSIVRYKIDYRIWVVTVDWLFLLLTGLSCWIEALISQHRTVRLLLIEMLYVDMELSRLCVVQWNVASALSRA